MDPDPDPDPTGIDLLGWDSHDVANVSLTAIATSAERLNLPRDLAFHPNIEGELWIVNEADHSVVVLQDAGTAEQNDLFFVENYSGQHFLAKPAALAFNDAGLFATAPEEDEPTQGNYTPWDFIGPTLWPGDVDIFDGGHASHMDMLHNSPNSVGIAWETGNAFWIYDGEHEALTRYDFRNDHGHGGSYHGDGIIHRYVEGQVAYEPDVSSHMEYDPDSALLYIAETARGQITVLDTTSGTRGADVGPNYDGGEQQRYNDAELWSLTTGSADVELVAPSGLALHDDLIWVTDNATSQVLAFTMDGELVDWLDTELPEGALMGIDFGPDGALYLVDAVDDQVLRLAPLEE